VVSWSVVSPPARFRHTCGTLGHLKNTGKSALGTLVRMFPPPARASSLMSLPSLFFADTPGTASGTLAVRLATSKTPVNQPLARLYACPMAWSVVPWSLCSMLHVAFCSPSPVVPGHDLRLTSTNFDPNRLPRPSRVSLRTQKFHLVSPNLA
jgi:hypothetical protein